MRRPRLLLLAILTASACGKYSPPSAPYETLQYQYSYGASLDDVWQAVLQTFADLEIPIADIEETWGLIKSDSLPYSPATDYSEVMDCGSRATGPVAAEDGFRPEVRLVVLVRQVRDRRVSLQIRTLMSGTLKDIWYNNCLTTGKLEERFLDQLQARIKTRLPADSHDPPTADQVGRLWRQPARVVARSLTLPQNRLALR